MSASLLFTINGENQEQSCLPLMTIGRDKKNHIVLPDPLVSRNHAIIRLLGAEDFYLIDSGSANGCHINGKRIATPVMLNDGDHIAIGSTMLQFHQIREHQLGIEESAEDETTVVVNNMDIRQITILVSDIRGFTTLSEEIPIKTLTRIMSDWFRHVSECVHTHHGTVDKFIGDCVYARWESGENEAGVIIQALQTALGIHDITQNLNREHPTLPRPLRIGVGLNTGKAAVSVGVDNTAIGDAVNLAFRLENATKELKSDIVLSESTFRYLPEDLWQQQTREISVKGKKAPIQVLALDFPLLQNYLARC